MNADLNDWMIVSAFAMGSAFLDIAIGVKRYWTGVVASVAIAIFYLVSGMLKYGNEALLLIFVLPFLSGVTFLMYFAIRGIVGLLLKLSAGSKK
jgi:hypothetical protein